MEPVQFVEALSKLKFENAFNPYSNRCVVHDLDDAPQRRLQTLLTVLEAATKQDIDSIWIGRDLGYRGGRRTGLALTDDVHIHEYAARWGLSIQRPTKGDVAAERTAAVIWSALSQIEVSVFLWNVFPLHPHEPGNPFSNRSHNSLERRTGEKFLSQLILLLKPRRLVAIGNDASRTAHRQDEVCIALEHVESWTGRIRDPGLDVSLDSQVKRFQAGDVLFGKLRPYLAKVARPDYDGLCVGEFLVLGPRDVV